MFKDTLLYSNPICRVVSRVTEYSDPTEFVVQLLTDNEEVCTCKRLEAAVTLSEVLCEVYDGEPVALNCFRDGIWAPQSKKAESEKP